LNSPFSIQIQSARIGIDRRDDIADEVRGLVQLIKCPVAYYRHIQNNREKGETIKQTFERVEGLLEEATGLRHYTSYEAFRVQKHRIQKSEGIGKQPTLFDAIS